jgi:hypothetical protein
LSYLKERHPRCLMKIRKAVVFSCCLLSVTILSRAQTSAVDPQVRTKAVAEGKVTVVDVAPHFVTGIRLPDPVNAIAVGDPGLFQVEHSEHEPELVLVKALKERSAETNLLISCIHGRQFSLLLVSRGNAAVPSKVDFLLQYRSQGSFLVEPEVVPFPFIGQTTPVVKTEPASSGATATSSERLVSFLSAAFAAKTPSATDMRPEPALGQSRPTSLDDLLERQENAPLPTLFGERIEGENVEGDRLRVGISEVIDGGEQVTVLFSLLNTSRHAILLMPPQVQLGGKSRTGKLVKHDRWSTAEQLPVADYRLSRRRVGTGGRADGVVVFERPPYKQSSEQLFLQMAESGAVDLPALAPIGFGVSSLRQEEDHGTRATRK